MCNGNGMVSNKGIVCDLYLRKAIFVSLETVLLAYIYNRWRCYLGNNASVEQAFHTQARSATTT